MHKRVVVIANPAAKTMSGKGLESAVSYFRANGHDAELLVTERSGHATELAHIAALQKPFRIIAAGGDGTINEVVNGIVHSGVPLGILPFGTSNVLAKELAIPENALDAADIVLREEPVTVSLGKIECMHGTSPAVRFFCLMAGIGFDADAVYTVDSRLKRVSGKGAYLYSGLRIFFSYHPAQLHFSVDGKEYTGYGAVIAKASKYGGNFRIAPDVSLTAPDLRICLFRGSRKRDLLRYVFGIIRGTHISDPNILYVRADTAEVLGPAHIQVDGDYLGTTPARLSVEKNALQVVWRVKQ